MPPGFGAGQMEVFQRRARQFELSRWLETDRTVGAGQREDLAVLLDRLPPEFGQPVEQIPDAAGFVPRRRAMVLGAIDELLMLGADPPALGGLLAAGEKFDQQVADHD